MFVYLTPKDVDIMEIESIDKKIKKLVINHETRDPFQIAKNLGILVVEEDLGEIYGFYNKENRIKMIHINSKLNQLNKRITAAHELGHAILHPSENTPMLSKITIVSELKIEKEANYFATNLLVDKKNALEECSEGTASIYYILKANGLPEHFDRFI